MIKNGCIKVRKKYNDMLKISISFVLATIIFIMPLSKCIYANEENVRKTDNEEKYRLGEVQKTNEKYGNEKNIGSKDIHYGWDLGQFYLKGYTSVITEDKSNPVFLKTVGDKVTLYFNLEQNINKLNGSSKKHISNDKNGIDAYFKTKKQKFHHGALIIRKTNYQNETAEPIIYTDYLKAIEKGAETKVDVFEEGDYEVALDYQITYEPKAIFGKPIFPEYYHYRIFFKFSVRNGNCMIYPFDVETKEELTNSAVTEEGFYLDFANSHYLDINIKKEVLNDGADGLVEDVRFNKPAKDGEEFTDEGIYTITASNRYTKTTTQKIIYVGTNDILKAYATTGLSINEIKKAVNGGATIDEKGFITLANKEVISSKENNVSEYISLEKESINDNVETDIEEKDKTVNRKYIVKVVVAIIIGVVAVVLIIRCKRANNKTNEEE